MTPPDPPSSLDGIKFDERTRASLRIVRERLNLSSDQEALRVLVVLGLEKMQEGLQTLTDPSHSL